MSHPVSPGSGLSCRRRRAVRRTLAGGAAAVGGVVAGAFLAARQISGPDRPWPDYRFTPFEIGADAADVTFTSADGTALAGWWFDDPDAEVVAIVCHGHRGNKSDMLGIGPGLWRAGFGVLLFDFRGCGDSGDGPQSLALFEQDDLRAAIDWVAARRPNARIALVGFSMGAATALMVAAQDPRVGVVVADSAFADMRGVVTTAVTRLRLPPFPLVWLTDRVTRFRYGYRFADVQPVDVVGRIAPRPVLLLHGTHDRIIGVEHVHRLADAAGDPTEVVLFDGADHCGGYFADRPGYIARVAAFLHDA